MEFIKNTIREILEAKLVQLSLTVDNAGSRLKLLEDEIGHDVYRFQYEYSDVDERYNIFSLYIRKSHFFRGYIYNVHLNTLKHKDREFYKLSDLLDFMKTL